MIRRPLDRCLNGYLHLPHICECEILGSCQMNGSSTRFIGSFQNAHPYQFWAIDDRMHYPVGITHYCWGKWGLWIGSNGHRILQHSSHQLMTFFSRPLLNYHNQQSAWYVADNWGQGLMEFVPYPNNWYFGSLDHTTHCQSSRIQLMTLQAQMMLTGMPKWVFCSFITWKLDYTELTSLDPSSWLGFSKI